MAGSPPRIEVRGAKEFRKAMQQAGADMDDLSATNKAAAELVEHEAESIVPVLSGRLRDSIKSKGTRTAGRVTAGARLVPYAGPIHFGWPAHGISPQPFLWEAADAKTQAVIDLYNDRVGKMVRKVEAMSLP